MFDDRRKSPKRAATKKQTSPKAWCRPRDRKLRGFTQRYLPEYGQSRMGLYRIVTNHIVINNSCLRSCWACIARCCKRKKHRIEMSRVAEQTIDVRFGIRKVDAVFLRRNIEEKNAKMTIWKPAASDDEAAVNKVTTANTVGSQRDSFLQYRQRWSFVCDSYDRAYKSLLI